MSNAHHIPDGVVLEMPATPISKSDRKVCAKALFAFLAEVAIAPPYVDGLHIRDVSKMTSPFQWFCILVL
jgi:hypothetical protein